MAPIRSANAEQAASDHDPADRIRPLALAVYGRCWWWSLLACLGTAPAFGAITELALSDGTQLVIAADGNAFDANPEPGRVAFNGRVGSFSVNVTTGISHPVIGSAMSPELNLVSVNTSSPTEGGRLQVLFSDKNLGGLPTEYRFHSEIRGSTAGTVEYQTLFDDTNTHFGRTATLARLTQLTGEPFFATASDIRLFTDKVYALTQIVDIVHPSPGMETSFDALLTGTMVPVPESVAACPWWIVFLLIVGRPRSSQRYRLLSTARTLAARRDMN